MCEEQNAGKRERGEARTYDEGYEASLREVDDAGRPAGRAEVCRGRDPCDLGGEDEDLALSSG